MQHTTSSTHNIFTTPILNYNSQEDAEETNKPEEPITDISFTEEEIIKEIGTFSNFIFAGPDGYPEFFCTMLPLAKPIYIIWRQFLDPGVTLDVLFVRTNF